MSTKLDLWFLKKVEGSRLDMIRGMGIGRKSLRPPFERPVITKKIYIVLKNIFKKFLQPSRIFYCYGEFMFLSGEKWVEVVEKGDRGV